MPLTSISYSMMLLHYIISLTML